MKYFFYSIFFVIPVLLFAGVGSHVNSLHTHYYKDGQVPYSPRNVHASSAGSFHLITHGRPGQLLIEGRWRNAAAIVQFIQQKQLFTPAVKQLNIYGCEFAKGAIGLAAVQYLEKHLQVRVAASTNITGAGGDYVLEIGSVNIAPLLAGFKGSLQCAGTPGGTAPGDDFDKDGICNSDDIDDDNDGVLDEMEMNCGQDYLNASDYQKGATVSTTTDLGGGGLVVTDFSTTRNFVLTDYPNGTAGGVISYLLDYDQGNPNFFYYITQLKFNKPVKVRIVFPGAGPAGEHNRTDIFTLTTPGSTTGFTVYNPDSAITITNNVAGEFSFNPNSADPDGEIAPSQQGYFVETTEWVTRLDIKVGSTRSGSVNDVSTRVIIMACNTLDIDTDGDGIFNRFDLDSDGDGCSDAEETGIVGTLQPAVLNNSSGPYYSTQALAQGAYGANGFADAIETSPGSGTYKGDYIAYSNATNNAIASCTPMPILTRPDMNVTLPGSAATGNLNTNDTVPGGSSYGSAVPVPGYSNPGTETPVVNTDGSYSFTGATPGVYKFYVPVCPPSVTENCPSELLTIQVVDPSQAGNPPVTGADIAVIQSGGAVTIPTLANDQAGGRGFAIDTSSLTISTPPKNGTATVNTTTGEITYTPNPAFTGTDTIYYTVCDNEATPNCNTGLQIITVQSPTAPNTVAAGDDYAAVQNGDTQTGSVTRNDYSANGSPLTATAQNTTIDGVGSLVISANGSYSFDPINNFTGPVNFPYQVCDGGDPAACTGATLFFLVTESPQNQVLPAKLVEFSGRNTGALNQLKWVTAIERNTSHFELWHGSNGNQFIPIATIAAAGNSNEVLTYRYDHTTPIAGNNYYRLVTVDKDGRRENSKIINITTRQPGTVNVYPNPTSGMFVLQGDKTELNAIALFNTIGVNITQQAQTLRISDEKIQINITALPNGIYYLRTSTQRFTIVKR